MRALASTLAAAALGLAGCVQHELAGNQPPIQMTEGERYQSCYVVEDNGDYVLSGDPTTAFNQCCDISRSVFQNVIVTTRSGEVLSGQVVRVLNDSCSEGRGDSGSERSSETDSKSDSPSSSPEGGCSCDGIGGPDGRVQLYIIPATEEPSPQILAA